MLMSSPFSHLQIDDWRELENTESRSTCQKCDRSRKYFCYTCYCPLRGLEHLTPNVKLPIDVDVIKHAKERDGKSTACHAAVISPGQVHIYTYPVIPDYDTDKTLLVFPGKDSVQLEDFASAIANGKGEYEDKKYKQTSVENSSECVTSTTSGDETGIAVLQDRSKHRSLTDVVRSDGDEDSVDVLQKCREKQVSEDTSDNPLVVKKERKCALQPDFSRVVFIDSTWNQTNQIVQDERLKDLRKVELTSRSTHFWRTQTGNPETYLSTIEAIYYFVQDYHSLFIQTPYAGQYDNLLFFFALLHEKINAEKDKKFKNGKT